MSHCLRITLPALLLLRRGFIRWRGRHLALSCVLWLCFFLEIVLKILVFFNDPLLSDSRLLLFWSAPIFSLPHLLSPSDSLTLLSFRQPCPPLPLCLHDQYLAPMHRAATYEAALAFSSFGFFLFLKKQKTDQPLSQRASFFTYKAGVAAALLGFSSFGFLCAVDQHCSLLQT
ncbi:hypothetical protein BJV82DRAFT_153092 [Fennellomyces sp. T-0311]|nr:hypothetical protein BJV82DRAFT_153092 [Fennellomyces sp. T-0311]